MAKYYLTNKAVEDLNQIWHYTFETWSENQADKYYILLIESFEETGRNSKIGKNYEEVIKDLYGLRTMRHIVFYRIISQNRIEITRVLHERMDLKNKLGK
jgi:toxin ParE1/3/4